MLLDGCVAVVTGGSRGIGKAIVEALADQGCRLVIGYNHNQQLAEELAKEIGARGREATIVQADVAYADQAKGLIDAALTRFGRLDILVNNAGIRADNLLIRMSEEEWDQVLKVNLWGVYHCCRAALRPMIKQRSGRIINISSIVGLAGNAGQANYAAAKAGIIGFTKSLAKEVGSRGILVNAIAPGYVITDMTQGLAEPQKDKLLSMIPLGRFARPEDIAGAVLFLASPWASYITGQVLGIDGGLAL
ncbi:MAG: 3-oxoacyl-[acyl-carrier-protein] reductase [Clostridia bacterium]|nr:3-oxoacyl-[acyl-carrier-protein] reductase [Clostridia bacterium]